MVDFFIVTALYINPILCILFTFKFVQLLKQIKRGEDNTQLNTFWVGIIFALIVSSITWTMFYLLD
jgi:ABC-type enterochelin transport system permease subunit